MVDCDGPRIFVDLYSRFGLSVNSHCVEDQSSFFEHGSDVQGSGGTRYLGRVLHDIRWRCWWLAIRVPKAENSEKRILDGENQKKKRVQ
jgi:hypothetical protein